MIKTYCDLCGAHDEECDSMLIGKLDKIKTMMGITSSYDSSDFIDHVCQVCQSDIDRFIEVLRK
jgi:hypothetical protein